MATSTKRDPDALSDASHGSTAARAPSPKRGYLIGLAAAAAVVVAGVIVVVGVDTHPDRDLLTFPEMEAPGGVALPEGVDPKAPKPGTDALAAAVEPVLNAKPLKGKTTLTVQDGITGDSLYDAGGTEAKIPASSTKVATAAAVLAARGGGYRIPTTVVAGENDGEVVLVAGGDVMLSAEGDGFFRGAASLADLAEQVRKSLGDKDPKKLIVDTSLFADDPVAPGVPKGDIEAGYTAKMAPMMLDGGRSEPVAGSKAPRYDDPATAVAEVFAGQLDVDFAEGEAPQDAKQLGVVHSPTIQRLAEFALVTSDNLLADALARQVAVAAKKEASFAGGVEATMDVLTELEVPLDGVDLSDGSGLSLDNRLTSEALSTIVNKAASGKHPEISGILSGFPVSGYSGALDDRYDSPDVIGKVRGKTGTLDKVNSLTGMTVTADGRLLTFAVIFNGGGDYLAVTEAIDKVAEALTRCGCE
ncbi:MAG: D-alanyl-D-alanine carboxypeptidase/D-alanyl-D-alanine endopeptidase [Stackebrandtia sp.]